MRLMMIIDLREEKSEFGCRYESNICPNVGDTVTLLQSTDEVKRFSAVILDCDHLIGQTVGTFGNLTEKLITCTVRRLS